ncbi:tRNA (adenosine(37)-N6)-threonylcarbamoyltransferase complex transferase subunit TsaD [Candidatus Woesebacteria bacterium RIFCSPHIGHO2_01_FULL_39_32]|uniref:tRNA N6-adenosine threonylcarbamoyltransferase n=2 Tax=Candidatus Woeseibacteriota TaxID=1752722 RepID=A0A1F8BIR5_9BACT|nr:MAG: tRNA (adenosine(37)-N6)-threonylcarbamoyltransferase complex transferase subunit TsaD [Candidatus Woesebacteria bacterium GWB1_37_5]OGM25032.1 MAG: tRNA (adenosine(37)-N6)-threonylcarbamoyltransferase complex transferase subunit TsaD [Candidatus Woesebacteria bacterium RIFCSPHIGHO2_01_FULL_39_32]OGM36620.1 MAG: tRNA (adenosine(37)-N6)-threonylcarbamoyltransferase complex transferase subunit TsaD [Candidatus Woesebacteria bacterium RIFCSPHIGHO2_12_FULL_38_11]OGM63947.1 MAG: tRNA (adenosin
MYNYPMNILGIETSCDETAASVVKNGTEILSNVVATSAEMHVKTGGIIPEQAARQQVRSIIPVIEEALIKAFGSPITNYQSLITKIDAIAVTIGPGLIGSLLVGVETAKTLSFVWKKPIVPVNHLVGHIYANWLVTDKRQPTTNLPKFPALVLVVSGGHTDLVLMKNHGIFEWLGGTRDDAAGESFDKTARLLGLPYPGGPSISAESEKYFNQQLTVDNLQLKLFPRPLIHEKNFDWSFSGLKTAVLRELTNQPINKTSIPKFAAEIQEAIIDCLVEKSIRAMKTYKPKSFLLGGGVAANKRLREKFLKRIKSEKLQVFHVAAPGNLCTDNAAYIASAAFFNFKPVNWKKIFANPQFTIMG